MKTRARHMYSQAKDLDLTDLPKHKECAWQDLACMQFSRVDARGDNGSIIITMPLFFVIIALINV
jgi:hypothetical protein